MHLEAAGKCVFFLTTANIKNRNQIDHKSIMGTYIKYEQDEKQEKWGENNEDKSFEKIKC